MSTTRELVVKPIESQSESPGSILTLESQTGDAKQL